MFFSERFQISSELLKEYGAVDISLVCDIPLFIDPMLIFNSEKEIYKNLHKSIIRYFHFLYTKAEQGLTMKEVSAWFNFSEVAMDTRICTPMVNRLQKRMTYKDSSASFGMEQAIR